MKISTCAALVAACSGMAGVVSANDRLDDIEKRLTALESVQFSGSFRMNYILRDNDDGQQDRAGDTSFNLFNLGVDAESNGIRFSGQYRWYNYTDTVHHLYLATDIDESSEFQLGLMKVPFGILPYESNNWWFGIPYYLGLNDDYDMGFKYLSKNGNWDIQMALYLGTEFGASNNNRYSVDVVNSTDNSSKNEEDNSINFRAAYALKNGEVGISLQAGQLYNAIEEKQGDEWAVALHHVGHFGNFHSQVEVIRYEFNPQNPDGVSDDVISVGALADTYSIASKGNIYVLNLAYDVALNNSRFENLRFYNDYSHLDKETSGFTDSQLNVTGVAVSAGAIYTNIDFIMGRNVLYISGARDAFAQGSEDDWSTRFNINIGYYF